MRTLILAMMCVALIAPMVPKNPASAEELRIATWNLEWFFDHDTSDNESELSREQSAPSKREFEERVEAIAEAIAAIDPALLALQEVENERVVADLADRLRQAHGLEYQVAFVQGRDDVTEQDVAMLIADGVPIDSARRLDFSPFAGDGDFKDLSKHLAVDVTVAGERVTVVTVHLIASSVNGRLRQARTLRAWTEGFVPVANVIVLGDFNTGLRFAETRPDSEIGIIRGFESQDIRDDLWDAHAEAAPRVTHVSGDELDRILLSPGLRDDLGLDFASVEVRRDLAIKGSEDQGGGVSYHLSKSQQDLSDHFPVVVTLRTAQEGPPGAPETVTRQDLLSAIEQVRLQLEALSEQVDEIRRTVERLPGN